MQPLKKTPYLDTNLDEVLLWSWTWRRKHLSLAFAGSFEWQNVPHSPQKNVLSFFQWGDEHVLFFLYFLFALPPIVTGNLHRGCRPPFESHEIEIGASFVQSWYVHFLFLFTCIRDSISELISETDCMVASSNAIISRELYFFARISSYFDRIPANESRVQLLPWRCNNK